MRQKTQFASPGAGETPAAEGAAGRLGRRAARAAQLGRRLPRATPPAPRAVAAGAPQERSRSGRRILVAAPSNPGKNHLDSLGPTQIPAPDIN